MIYDQMLLDVHPEIIVDGFAGGGGASAGIEEALGRTVDKALNHDPAATAMHRMNHPQTQHFVADIFETCPHAVTEGRRVGLAWFSPDCTYHSKARGGIIDRGLFPDGSIRVLTQEEQVRMCGNSVPPKLSAALARANVPEMVVRDAALPQRPRRRRATAGAA